MATITSNDRYWVLSTFYIANNLGLLRKHSLCVCKECGNEWVARYDSLKIGYKRNKCCRGLTISELNTKFLARKIQVLKLYSKPRLDGKKSPIRYVVCKCLACDSEWEASLPNVTGGTGCPSCSGKVLTLGQIRKELSDSNITVQKAYLKSVKDRNYTYCTCSCKICGNMWSVKAASVIRNFKLYRKGCRKCSGVSRRLTLDEVSLSSDSSVEVLSLETKSRSKTGNTGTYARCKCIKCGNMFETLASLVKRGKRCPECAKWGFNKSKPAQFYFYSLGNDFIGFGITNDPKTRHSKHLAAFKKADIKGELLGCCYSHGHLIHDLELHLKRTLNIVDSGIIGFRTEAISINDAEAFRTILEDLTNNGF